MTRTSVWCTTTFEAMHSWPEAKEEVEFLKYPHRHIFHVRLEVEVDEDDREVEFITLKRELNSHLASYGGDLENASCEMAAKDILGRLALEYKVRSVTVSEDGENGATVWVEGPSPKDSPRAVIDRAGIPVTPIDDDFPF